MSVPGTSTPFRTITIDGRRLDGPEIMRWAEELAIRQGHAPWTLSIRDTLNELTTDDGSITVRSSGTTGPPKSFRISADDLIASARLTEWAFGLERGDGALLCLPCTFVAGKLMLVRAFVSGLDLHPIDPHGPVLTRLRRTDRFAFTAMVPRQLLRMLQNDRQRVAHTFGTILLGGGPVGPLLIGAVQDLDTRVFQSYGSTETVTHAAVRPLNASAGAGQEEEPYSALRDVRFGTDDRGCLVVRTPHLSTREHVTNDLVELMDERRFRWLGRADHVILSGGRKIHPERLEQRVGGLIARPHFFTGMPHDELGQYILLVLEGDPLSASEHDTLLEELSRALEPFEMPMRIEVRKDLRRTGSGKYIR